MKIAHTADWHIRSLLRHDEYRKVFSNLKKSLVDNNVDVLWIGGDLWHTKLTGISPEFIRFFSETLSSLSEVVEVYLMCGNHDGNLANSEREDAISPIIELMNNPRVKLYKKSGIFPLNEEINWCVFSLFDTENWSKVLPEKGKYNIACFHGAVSGAKTCTDWELEGEKTVADFEEYDIALLGDIHKMQYLGNFLPPRIAYPGSIIQQSYDEDLDHGYLLWTIEASKRNHQVEFVKIQGGNPFITLHVNDENINLLLKNAISDFEGARCRLVCDNLTIVQKNSLKESFLRENVHEVVLLDNQKNEKGIKKQIAEAVKLDSVESLIKQAKHYTNYNIKTNNSWEEIELLVRYYADKLKVGSTKPHRWTMKNFEFDNLYSYGNGNRIDFSNFGGLVGITGPNASGKSSVLGALLYGLFNSSDRDCSKNAFYINDLKDSSRTHCEIEVDGSGYDIARTSTRSSTNRESSSTKLLLSSKVENLTGEQRNDTDKAIKDLIGSVEDFMLTSMAAQEDLGKFLKEGSTTRKEIVSRFLGIDCLSDIHSLAKKDMNLVKNERKSISNLSSDTITKEISANENSLLSLKLDIEKFSNLKSSLSKEIQKIELDFAKNGVELFDKKIAEKDLNNLILKRRDLESQIDNFDSSCKKIHEELSEVDQKISTIDVLEIAKKLKEAVSLKENLFSKRNDFNISEEKFKSAKKSSLKLLEVPCGDDFPTCKFIVDSHKDKAILDELHENLEEIKLSVADLSLKLEEFKIDDLLEKNKTRDALSKKKEFLTKEIASLEKSNDTNKRTLQKIIEDISSIESRLKFSDEAAFENLSKMKMKLVDLERSMNLLHSSLGSLEKEIQIKKKQLETCLFLDGKMNLLEVILEIFSKDGLPRFIMIQHLDHINTRMNDLLTKVVDFTVELRMDDEKGNLEVILNKKDRKRIAELGSGMERTLVSLALRVALRDISCIPMPDFFVLDEGLSMLDTENILACKNLLNELKKIFRFVIVMTHNDTIKEMMDKTIEVNMVGDFSRIDAGV